MVDWTMGLGDAAEGGAEEEEEEDEEDYYADELPQVFLRYDELVLP